MNTATKHVQSPTPKAMPEKTAVDLQKKFVKPELKRQGSIEKVTGFTF